MVSIYVTKSWFSRKTQKWTRPPSGLRDRSAIMVTQVGKTYCTYMSKGSNNVDTECLTVEQTRCLLSEAEQCLVWEQGRCPVQEQCLAFDPEQCAAFAQEQNNVLLLIQNNALLLHKSNVLLLHKARVLRLSRNNVLLVSYRASSYRHYITIYFKQMNRLHNKHVFSMICWWEAESSTRFC